ncbi:MAG: zinc-ribbon domain-containing protein [Clostridia bacterium]|jgi:5-bromo-4-chloroindolyl phosphate hydrolysis protein|nr:zinc-ribbon domain-containing protein [Clostridia bacterium]
MYCQKCGTKIEDISNYCRECGFRVNPDKEEERDKLLLSVKPKFDKMVSISEIELNQIVFTVIATVAFGFYTLEPLSQTGISSIVVPIMFALYGIIFFAMSTASKYYLEKNTLEKTEYRFFKNKLEYFEGFSTMEQKIVKYRNVTEIYMRRSVLQKKANVGTIVISTPMTSMKNNGARSNGVVLKNVENPTETYKAIRKLINEAE